MLALRSLGAVTANYQMNGGADADRVDRRSGTAARSTATSTSRYYHVMRGEVTGTNPGDTVEVWFDGGGQTSDSFTYQAVNESTNDVLVLAAEDYTGASPVAPASRRRSYLSYYLDALAANGIGYDVYDVDANGRTAPTTSACLSHYEAVIWYTGDDIVTREPGWGAGNASRLAMDELLQVRAYLNEGGKVLYTGKSRGHQYTPAHGAQLYDPTEANERCTTPPAPTLRRCLILYGSPSSDLQNDVLEYWFGAFLTNDGAGLDDDGNTLDVIGIDTPFTGLDVALQRRRQRRQPDRRRRVVHHDERDPAAATYPQFDELGGGEVRPAGRAVRPAHRARRTCTRRSPTCRTSGLTHTINVPAGGREHVVLDVLRHRARLGPPVRRGPHRGPGRLDDARTT